MPQQQQQRPTQQQQVQRQQQEMLGMHEFNTIPQIHLNRPSSEVPNTSGNPLVLSPSLSLNFDLHVSIHEFWGSRLYVKIVFSQIWFIMYRVGQKSGFFWLFFVL